MHDGLRLPILLASVSLGLFSCGKDKTAGPEGAADSQDSGAPDSGPTDSDGTDSGADISPVQDVPAPDTAAPDGEFPTIASTPGRSEYAFEHDGLTRTFLVYIPTSVGEHPPLMVVLHGGGGAAKQMLDHHAIEVHADEVGYVIVAGQGTPKDGEKNSYDWNGQVSLDSGVDDVGYIERIIVGLTDQLNLDAKRRYLAGFSGGASMTIRFGAERTELLAAIGTFAGKVGLSEAGGPFVFPPLPTGPLSVQLTYGTDDPNLLGELKGDVQATTGRAGIEWWASSLGCAANPATSVTGKLTFDAYGGCTGGAVVRMVTVDGMPHTWPEKEEDGLDGTKLLLDFFADKARP